MHVALSVEAGAHRDQIGMNTQHVGDDLRRSGFMSLALRTRTNCDNDLSVNVELAVRTLRVTRKRGIGIDDLRLSEIVGAGIERRSNPDTDQATFFTSL